MNSFIDVTDITETTLITEDVLTIFNGDHLREYFSEEPDFSRKNDLLKMVLNGFKQ